MKNKYKVFGYEAKESYVNPMTGMRTIEIDKELLQEIKTFSNEVLGKGIEIRGLKDKGNKFSFKCGVGYDVIDTDLLGGYGDGVKAKIFESYLDYKKEKKEYILNNMESYIDRFNEYHPNDQIPKTYIENENSKSIKDKWNIKKDEDELERN